MGVMHEAVEDSVGEGRITEHRRMPQLLIGYHLSIKNRGGCDALRDDLADFIDAVAVSTSASLALACLTVLETRRQLDDLAIFVDEGKTGSLSDKGPWNRATNKSIRVE